MNQNGVNKKGGVDASFPEKEGAGFTKVDKMVESEVVKVVEVEEVKGRVVNLKDKLD